MTDEMIAPDAVDKTLEICEVRLQGRGGQGIVTAGELLGLTAIAEGRFAQSIPTFGPERRGALSSCSLRISKTPILLKCSTTTANMVCVFDPTIWHFVNTAAGLSEGGVLVFNTTKSPETINEALRSGQHGYALDLTRYAVHTVDATGIALEILGKVITNTAMIGAFARATGLVQMASVAAVFRDRFGKQGDVNARIAAQAFDAVKGVVFEY